MEDLSTAVKLLLDRQGTFSYAAGTGGGTVTPTAGQRVLEISGFANASDGTVTIFGGPPITVRAGQAFTLRLDGTLVGDGAKAIVFSVSMDYFVGLLD